MSNATHLACSLCHNRPDIEVVADLCTCWGQAVLPPVFFPAYNHSNARLQDKADVVKVTMGATAIEAMDFSDLTVRVYGTTALIRANVDMRNSTGGKSTTSHINVLFVWLKGPGGWQLVGRQATQVSPPTTP